MNCDEKRALKFLRERNVPDLDEKEFRKWCEKNRKLGETPNQIAIRYIVDRSIEKNKDILQGLAD